MAPRSTFADSTSPATAEHDQTLGTTSAGTPERGRDWDSASLARSASHAARLGVYTALGASASAVPLPWLPDMLVRRVWGALVHDIAVHHSVSLTIEARSALSDPAGPGNPPGVFSQALHFFGIRLAARILSRFGPIAMAWPAQTALRTYVLGRMFDRYLQTRSVRAVRVDGDEARRVRRAIDGVLSGAIAAEPATVPEPAAIDDQRDPTTAFVDGLLGAAAGMPERVLRRLDTAFDEALARALEPEHA
jgi:hypothetical protein